MKLHPLAFAFLITVLDALWAQQAFGVVRTNAGSNVALASLICWATVHLPAGILAGLLLRPFGVLAHGAAGLPAWSLELMKALGLVQIFALSYGLSLWWQRRSSARA